MCRAETENRLMNMVGQREGARQEYWSRLPFLSPGIFLTQDSKLGLLHCRQILYLWGKLQKYMNQNFLMFKLVLEKAEEPEIKLPTCTGSSKKQESSRKTFISALLSMPKPLTVWTTTNSGKFFKRWEYQTT